MGIAVIVFPCMIFLINNIYINIDFYAAIFRCKIRDVLMITYSSFEVNFYP